MDDYSSRPVRLLSYQDDRPNEQPGALIPRPRLTPMIPKRAPLMIVTVRRVVAVVVPMVAVAAFALIGIAGYGLVASNNLASTPNIFIVDPYTKEESTLTYGPQIALTKNSFFIETRDTFVEEGMTFLEVDINSAQVRYFKRGVLLQSAEILSEGESGSWWAVPAGLYNIEGLEERQFSNLAQLYFPNTIRFGGNYFIHGWPEYPDGTLAKEEETAGGIRLDNESAALLYRAVHEEMPILVHRPPAEVDTFVYEPTVENVTAPHYLIADVENGTILASNDLHVVAPIASVTKLMTAVVAAENIDLDTRVKAISPTFVQSLIPRLSGRTSASMYSLLQLLLVESSNEAAEVIANQMGREEFIKAMNDKARHLGMMETTFTDPSGLDSTNVSSVGDLYTLVRYIEQNRSFIFEITDTNHVVKDDRGGEFDGLVNFNQIENIDNFIGGKVGETEAAGQTSVSLHEVSIQGEERIVMIVLLGSESRTDDVNTLMNHVMTRFVR